jgi:hypothetical protein
VLVRPDGFVAWRARRAPASAASGQALLVSVLERALDRSREQALAPA